MFCEDRGVRPIVVKIGGLVDPKTEPLPGAACDGKFEVGDRRDAVPGLRQLCSHLPHQTILLIRRLSHRGIVHVSARTCRYSFRLSDD